MKMISEFTDHDRIEGQFLLGSVSKGVPKRRWELWHSHAHLLEAVGQAFPL